MTLKTIPLKALLNYGFIALPVAFAGFPLYILAPDFYATQHHVSLTLLGTLLLVIRLFDAVQDPVIGWLVDGLRGRFLPLLWGSGFLLCLAIYGLFNSLWLAPAAWFALCMFFAVAAYSCITIILGAQATLWTADKQDQMRIASTREAFGLIGLIIAVLMPAVLAHFVEPQHIYPFYTAVLAFIMIIGLVSISRLVKPTSLPQPRPALLSAFHHVPAESWRLFGVYSVSMLASSIPAILVIFYVRDLLGAAQLTGAFLLLYFLSGVLAMPLWNKLSLKLGKHRAWGVAHILAVCSFIGAFFLGGGDVWGYALVCTLSGLALGADLTLPPAILADTVHAHNQNAYAATHYALLPFIAKASLAVASAMALPALDAAGFKPDAANSESALAVLSLTYALIPCGLKLVAAGLLLVFFYPTLQRRKS